MLTGRQQEIWDFLVDYVGQHGYPPTVREIGERVGLASPSTVHAHLANLERAGYLRRDPTKPRALELTGLAPPGRGNAGGSCRRRRCRSSARSPRADRCSPRRTSRSTSTLPEQLVGGGGRLPAARQGRLDDRSGDPRGRPRRRAAPDDGDATARSSSRSPATTRPPTRRPSSATSARTAASGSSPRTTRSSRSTRSTSRSSARWWGCSGRCDGGAVEPDARPGALRAAPRREPRVPRLRRVRAAPARRDLLPGVRHERAREPRAEPDRGYNSARRPGDRGALCWHDCRRFEESPDTAGQDAGETPGGESRRKVAQKGDRLRRTTLRRRRR